MSQRRQRRLSEPAFSLKREDILMAMGIGILLGLLVGGILGGILGVLTMFLMPVASTQSGPKKGFIWGLIAANSVEERLSPFGRFLKGAGTGLFKYWLPGWLGA